MGVAVSATYGKVVGRLIRTMFVPSGSVANGVPIPRAKVVFTASMPLSTTSSEVYIADSVTAYTNDDGYLCSDDGTLGVLLLATNNTALSAKDWTWNVKVMAPSIVTQSWSIAVPGNSTIDLATAVKLPPDPGNEIALWQQVLADAEAARDQAQVYANNASNSATLANQYKTSASSSADSAAGYRNSAQTYANNAASSATSAATSATNAASSATLASAKALAASDSATSAASSSTSAQASALAAEQAKEQGSQLLVQKGNVSGTLDLSTVTTNQIVHLTRVGNIVVNLPTSPIVGQTITLVMKKDATATVYSFNLKNVITAYGVSITPSSAANTLDEIMCFYDGVRWKARVSGLSDAIPTAWVVS